MNNDHAMCLTSVGLTLCVVTFLGPSCDNKYKLGISMKKFCDDCLGIVGIEALQVSVLCFYCKEDRPEPGMLDRWV